MTFEVGQQVIVVRGSFSSLGCRYWTIGTVYKVYKNGKFILEHGGLVYRPNGRPVASAYTIVHPYTDELLTELEEEKRNSDDAYKLHLLCKQFALIRNRKLAADVWRKIPPEIQALIGEHNE